MNAQHDDREELDEFPADPDAGELSRTAPDDPQSPTRPDRWLWIPAG